MEFKHDFGHSLGQKLELNMEQQVLFRLTQELSQQMGKFEKQILEKAEFFDIDFDTEKSEYHIEMLRNLLMKESEDKDSLISSIVKNQNKNIDDIEKIIVQSFNFGDISFDIGMNRNVDVLTMVFNDNQSFTMTVSLDKDAFIDIADSPSFKEADILKSIDSTEVWSLQKYFGLTEIKYPELKAKKILICKEFVHGQMLENYITNLEDSEEQNGIEIIKKIAHATGKAFANTLDKLKGIPSDSNTLNLIVSDVKNPDEEITVRWCDVEEINIDKHGIYNEINMMSKNFDKYVTDFHNGIVENYKGKLWKLEK